MEVQEDGETCLAQCCVFDLLNPDIQSMRKGVLTAIIIAISWDAQHEALLLRQPDQISEE